MQWKYSSIMKGNKDMFIQTKTERISHMHISTKGDTIGYSLGRKKWSQLEMYIAEKAMGFKHLSKSKWIFTA